ncbi:MAG: hypothetical protein HUJ26_12995 [Planctomycetaceae bacterium]|nr:hypothetical protein [Planctomycetaceae bacterium]
MDESIPDASDFPDHIIDIHYYELPGWFYITILSDEAFIAGATKISARMKILSALQQGADAAKTLKPEVPFGQTFLNIPVDQIERIEYHEDDCGLAFYYQDDKNKKLRSRSYDFINEEERTRFLISLESLIGQWEMDVEEASFWHLGIWPMILAIINSLLCGLFAVASYFDRHGPNPASARRGKADDLAKLFDFLGPTGILLIGLGMNLGLIIWWIAMYRRGAEKIVARPTQNQPFE